ncbi:uncharacterized protein MONBRDRAFT_22348 [Monosiga brevicollis MX1]|uniref:FYVE-type domain-containing protein n=1 Tax=Monosiga brevicollis TaxID=81824 RepID=A9UQB4_MONBE|nr:uncharacterized protein MONBRDRAFT_22348 [Monosiga brevicollis MX1]EDQ93019.1 predicted protein [Monosiga brevicollis MX1]|eukprot:XP_001742781.1 hypothetical protein [Monosiga brevicollis MX1]
MLFFILASLTLSCGWCLMFSKIKRKTTYPLHLAVQLQREDVVFLYLVENDLDLRSKINECNDQGTVPLKLALDLRNTAIATTLVQHNADVNAKDEDDVRHLLHSCIEEQNETAALFLIENNADPRVTTAVAQATPLHCAALADSAAVTAALLKRRVDVNARDHQGDTPSHCAIRQKHAKVVDLLLSAPGVDVNITNNEGHTPLWLALGFEDQRYAQQLVDRGCDVNLQSVTGDTMLHDAIYKDHTAAALFLIDHNCNVHLTNQNDVTPLHAACANGNQVVCESLLKRHSNVNARNKEGNTPLMTAVIAAKPEWGTKLVETLLAQPSLDVNLVNYEGRSALALALANEDSIDVIGPLLLQAEADAELVMPDGYNLLQTAILANNTKAATLLIRKPVQVDIPTPDGRPPLLLAVEQHSLALLHELCRAGCNVYAVDTMDNYAMWSALSMEKHDLARALIEHGFDVNCLQVAKHMTLLHQAVSDLNISIVSALLALGADVNGRRDDDDGTPLHMAAAIGADANEIIRTLIQRGADVNAQDRAQETPLHRAIYAQQEPVAMKLLGLKDRLKLGLRDQADRTVFGAALFMKNLHVASGISRLVPSAIEERNRLGMTYLHEAVADSNIETVEFLLKLKVDVNARMADSTKRTPLATAVEREFEQGVRALLLAGADHSIADADTRWTVAHIAALLGNGTIFKLLVEHGANCNAADADGNTVLHVAMKRPQAEIIRQLTKIPGLDFFAENNQKQTPLHLLAESAPPNGLEILKIIFELINHNLSPTDAEGNTPLHVAMRNGASDISMGLIRNGAHPGVPNAEGACCFDIARTSPKLGKLLIKLLELIRDPPAWIEAPYCQECKSKFTSKTRKHHCRHCGRVVCKKDSTKQCPIVKFQMPKPQRVCDLCHLVLTGGVGDLG